MPPRPTYTLPPEERIPGAFIKMSRQQSTANDTEAALRVQKGSIYRRRRRSRQEGTLRIALVCENLMPNVDGVTRCLARLLEHLHAQGHEVVVLGPETGMKDYETYPLVGTAGIPLVLYPGLKLNFLRPLFLRTILDFDPDVIHVVDPIWLGAQVLWALRAGWCGPEWMQGGKPIVASYHTNLATYASLFGFGWLEPRIWNLLRNLHSKCLLTACPSQSTADLLKSRGIEQTRIWPRGVDVSLFNPGRRRADLRRKWFGSRSRSRSGSREGSCEPEDVGAEKSLPTPPPTPEFGPLGDDDEPVVILYVGRISHEKNLSLLINAYAQVTKSKSKCDLMPPTRLVLVGDGPARHYLEEEAHRLGLGAEVVFEGHIGDPGVLAGYYASADVFAFPSFTETFGQVICEALASGLPVVGLDADGTRDLVRHDRTGLLLPNPTSSPDWAKLCADRTAPVFNGLINSYAGLLEEILLDPSKRSSMRRLAPKEGIEGRTWFDAMNAMVDCYREGIEISRRTWDAKMVESEKGRRSVRPGCWWHKNAGGMLCTLLSLMLMVWMIS